MKTLGHKFYGNSNMSRSTARHQKGFDAHRLEEFNEPSEANLDTSHDDLYNPEKTSSLPRWVKVAVSGTMRIFINKWKNSDVHVDHKYNRNFIHFSAAELPNLDQCHREASESGSEKMKNSTNFYPEYGREIPDTDGSHECCSQRNKLTTVVILLGLLFVLACGGIPLLVFTLLPDPDSVQQTSTVTPTSEMSSSIVSSISDPSIYMNEMTSETTASVVQQSEYVSIVQTSLPVPSSSKLNSDVINIQGNYSIYTYSLESSQSSLSDVSIFSELFDEFSSISLTDSSKESSNFESLTISDIPVATDPISPSSLQIEATSPYLGSVDDTDLISSFTISADLNVTPSDTTSDNGAEVFTSSMAVEETAFSAETDIVPTLSQSLDMTSTATT